MGAFVRSPWGLTGETCSEVVASEEQTGFEEASKMKTTFLIAILLGLALCISATEKSSEAKKATADDAKEATADDAEEAPEEDAEEEAGDEQEEQPEEEEPEEDAEKESEVKESEDPEEETSLDEKTEQDPYYYRR